MDKWRIKIENGVWVIYDPRGFLAIGRCYTLDRTGLILAFRDATRMIETAAKFREYMRSH